MTLLQKKERKKERQSNFELLRITAMILVLLCHYIPTRHNGIFSPAFVQEGSNPLSTDLLNTITNLELRSLCICCTHCFILISGYFGINFKIQSLANLIFQMLFWCITCFTIAILLIPGFSSVPSPYMFIRSIVWGWFPEGYMILVILSPILNSFIRSCTNKELGKYILYFYALSTIAGYILQFVDYREGMSVISMCGLYLLGAYIRNSNIKIFNLKSRYDFLIYIGLGFAMVALNILLLSFRIYTSPYGYLNPVVILMAIYLFLFFKKINIPEIKVINFFSASAFSIYLFHCNKYTGETITNMWKQININYGTYTSLIIAFASFIAIYLFCTLIDQIRIFLWKNISNRL